MTVHHVVFQLHPRNRNLLYVIQAIPFLTHRRSSGPSTPIIPFSDHFCGIPHHDGKPFDLFRREPVRCTGHGQCGNRIPSGIVYGSRNRDDTQHSFTQGNRIPLLSNLFELVDKSLPRHGLSVRESYLPQFVQHLPNIILNHGRRQHFARPHMERQFLPKGQNKPQGMRSFDPLDEDPLIPKPYEHRCRFTRCMGQFLQDRQRHPG